MRDKRHRGRFRRFQSIYQAISTIFLNAVLFLLILEIGSRLAEPIYRAFQYEMKEAAYGSTLEAALPGLTRAERKQLEMESIDANRLTYAPWVQFRMRDFAGNYVNIHGLRRGNGDDNDRWKNELPDENHVDVYFFGGSTMFGYGVPDNDTIPAWFRKLSPSETQLRAFNYGQPYYYSRQESVLFEKLLRDGHRPDIAVFLDGLNDTIQVGSSYSGIPFFTPRLTSFLSDNSIVAQLASTSSIVTALRHFMSIDLSNKGALYSHPAGQSIEQIGETILQNYVESVEYNTYLCERYDVKCFFFWQPIPNYRYFNPSDGLSSQIENPLNSWVYGHVDNVTMTLTNFKNLSDMLVNYGGQPFVDLFHYSAPCHQEIAQRMLLTISLEQFSEKSPRPIDTHAASSDS